MVQSCPSSTSRWLKMWFSWLLDVTQLPSPKRPIFEWVWFEQNHELYSQACKMTQTGQPVSVFLLHWRISGKRSRLEKPKIGWKMLSAFLSTRKKKIYYKSIFFWMSRCKKWECLRWVTATSHSTNSDSSLCLHLQRWITTSQCKGNSICDI